MYFFHIIASIYLISNWIIDSIFLNCNYYYLLSTI
nr:MAG TPA: hypothetical protein [Caudoviricetes sp.]